MKTKGEGIIIFDKKKNLTARARSKSELNSNDASKSDFIKMRHSQIDFKILDNTVENGLT